MNILLTCRFRFTSAVGLSWAFRGLLFGTSVSLQKVILFENEFRRRKRRSTTLYCRGNNIKRADCNTISTVSTTSLLELNKLSVAWSKILNVRPEINITSEECVDHPYVRAPVDKNSPCYNMGHKRRGDAIIFHHEKFDTNLELKPRDSDKKLLTKLVNVLKGLEFSVCVYEDLTYKEIAKKITTCKWRNYPSSEIRMPNDSIFFLNSTTIVATKKDQHKKSDCILFVFMTHGYNGKLYAKDTHYNPDPLRLLFTSDNCPSLAGKPKIFIIQACRGDQPDCGTSLTPRSKHAHHRVSSSDETDGHKSQPFKMATHADFLIANSTVSSTTNTSL